MARLPRLIVPGQAHHVLQRSNGGQTAFVDAQDYQAMLALLAEFGLEALAQSRFKLPQHAVAPAALGEPAAAVAAENAA